MSSDCGTFETAVRMGISHAVQLLVLLIFASAPATAFKPLITLATCARSWGTRETGSVSSPRAVKANRIVMGVPPRPLNPNAPQGSAASRLRDLLAKPGILTMPCCFDALSARLIERAGFEITFMSGFSTSAAKLGLPDTGYISYGEMIDAGAPRAWSFSL